MLSVLKAIFYYGTLVMPLYDGVKAIIKGVKAGHDVAVREREYELAQQNYQKFMDFLEQSMIEAQKMRFESQKTELNNLIFEKKEDV